MHSYMYLVGQGAYIFVFVFMHVPNRVGEQQRFGRDCAYAQARLSLRCSHMRYVLKLHELVYVFRVSIFQTINFEREMLQKSADIYQPAQI